MRLHVYRVFSIVLLAVIPHVSQASLTDSGLTFGPYLQRVNKHAATILARSDTATTVDLYYRAVGAAHWKHNREDSADTQHRYRLTNLKRGRDYEYYLQDDAGNRLTQTYTMQTQKDVSDDDPLRVAVFGDSGINTITQYEVASEITSWQPELLLHTGDIAYNSGTEQEFIDNFFVVYSNLLPEVPFYGSIGNHEYTTDSAGPYKDLFETPKNGADEDYYSFNYDQTHFVSLNANLDFSVGSTMYEWLKDDLENTNKRWVIVFFHQPVYSSSTHGSTPGMAEALVPLFEDNHVDLVLNGHDHAYERFRKTNGVTYIVTGGGGNVTYPIVSELENSVFFLEENHFVGLMITDSAITIKAIDEDGFVFDTVTIDA